MPTLSKKSIRGLPPQTRKVAKLASELASVQRRLFNILPTLELQEQDAKAPESGQGGPVQRPQPPRPGDSGLGLRRQLRRRAGIRRLR